MGVGVKMDPSYSKIKVRLVFDVKASGKRKGRLVARGDLTPEPEEAVYSSVASLRSLPSYHFHFQTQQIEVMTGRRRQCILGIVHA